MVDRDGSPTVTVEGGDHNYNPLISSEKYTTPVGLLFIASCSVKVAFGGVTPTSVFIVSLITRGTASSVSLPVPSTLMSSFCAATAKPRGFLFIVRKNSSIGVGDLLVRWR